MRTIIHRVLLACAAGLVAFVGARSAHAMEASPHPFEVEQPDGTKVTLHVRGNEHFHWLEDPRGYTVVRDKGWHVYGRRGVDGRLAPTGFRVGRDDPQRSGLSRRALPSDEVIREERGRRFGRRARPSRAPSEDGGGSAGAQSAPQRIAPSGTVKNLVVMIRFANHSNKTLPSTGDLDVLFNAVGGHPTLAPTGSVKDVYLENSYGQFTLQSDLTGWIDVSQNESYYADGEGGSERLWEALEEALTIAETERGVDFSDYDTDGDGFIDAIAFVHSGYGAEWTGNLSWIWSHRWAIQSGAYIPSEGRYRGWVSSDGVEVYDYHISTSLWGTSGSQIGRVGVISHETGHFFGLPDLYDSDLSGEGIGGYGLMADSWGFDGEQLHPPHLCAFSKIFLGWLTPTVISSPGTYSATQVESAPEIYRIDQGYPSGEYLLIENRQPVGFDGSMPQGGLCIWHIDENAGWDTEGYPGQSGWPGNGNHYAVALLQADGQYNLQKGQNRGDAGDVFHAGGVSLIGPGTVPNTHAYQSGNVSVTHNTISNISASGSTMTFDYSVEEPPPPGPETDVAVDDFESGTFGGGSGWLGGWSMTSGVINTTSGGPAQGSFHARIAGGGSSHYMERTLDLTGRTGVKLEFRAQTTGFEGSDQAYVWINDGSGWVDVLSWAGNTSYQAYTVDLSSFAMTSNFTISFDTYANRSNEYYYVDDVRIVADDPTPQNQPPVATDDAGALDEGGSLVIDVLANDTDAEGDPLSVTAVTLPAHGVATSNGDGTITYTPEADYFGSDTFGYTVSDDQGGSDSATVSITVNGVNDAPVAMDDAVAIDEDEAATVAVLSNDGDVDGDALTVTGTTQGASGSVSTDGTSVTYTPNQDFHGADAFTYTISDGNGGSDTATVSVTVTSVNDAPVASDDGATVAEDGSVQVAVLANDTDADGDTLSVTATTQGSNGSVSTDGTSVTYTPNQNFSGADSFGYTVSDGSGGTDTATVSVTVTAVPDAPVASDDSATTDEDVAVEIAVLGNDTDGDGDTLSIATFTQPANGAVVQVGNALSYTPSANWSGVDGFTYTISDGNGGSDTATVQVTVASVNDAPVASNDGATVVEDGSVPVAVLANDTDADGDTLSITAVTQGANGSVVNNGTSVTYTPNQNFSGADSFGYTVSDGNGGTDTATVSVTVTPVPDAPIASDDSATTDEDVAVLIAVLGNDTDGDGDTLSIASFTQPANGSVAQVGSALSYTPSANWSGVDGFTYAISDGSGGSDTATVQVTVASVNDAPVASNDGATVVEDGSVPVAVLANDTDADGDSLAVAAVTQGANGSVVNNGTSVTYTPNQNFSGTDSFGYTVSDGNGGSDTATVDVTITSVNDLPVANDDAAQTEEDTPVDIDLLSNDTDDDPLDVLQISGLSQPAHGTVTDLGGGTVRYQRTDAGFFGADSFTYTLSDGNGGTDTATVLVTVLEVNFAPTANDDTAGTDEDVAVAVFPLGNDTDPDGDTLSIAGFTQPANGTVVQNGTSLTYTPGPDWSGVDSFTYSVSDGREMDDATVTVTVAPLNDAPVANDDGALVQEDGSVIIAVLGNDSDVDGDALSVTVVSPASNGLTVTNGDTITYTPNADYDGPDSFAYTISDGNGGTDSALVTVTVAAVNDAPAATDDEAVTAEDAAVEIFVLTNDSDVDGDALFVSAVGAASNGSVQNDGTSVTYTPNGDFHGTDGFTYTVSDGNGGTDTATVLVTVSPVNDAPAATDDAATTDEGVAVPVFVLANDTDVDGDPLVVQSATDGASGSVTHDGTSVTYTPDPGFRGTDAFAYTVSDGQGGTDTATVTVTVNASAPVGPNLSRGIAVSGSGWVTVDLPATYTSPVVVCTPSYTGSVPAVVRVRNAGATSFQMMVVRPSTGAAQSGMNVHWFVVEEGVYTQAEHGVRLEAVRYTSTKTAAKGRWGNSYVDTRSYQQGYGQPVVVGQVMTANDGDWSVFLAYGSSRTNPPNGTLRTSKSVCEDPDRTRANETIGYVVIEAGQGAMNGVGFVAALTNDTVQGTGNTSVGYAFALPFQASTAAVSIAGLDGGDGGWPVLYGTSPLSGSQIRVAIQEDTISNTESNHTTEQVGYIAFD